MSAVVVVVGSVVVVVVVDSAVVVVVGAKVVVVVVAGGRVVVVVVVDGGRVVVDPWPPATDTLVVTSRLVLDDPGVAESLTEVDELVMLDGAVVVERSTCSPRTRTGRPGGRSRTPSTTTAIEHAATTSQNQRPSRTNCTLRRYRGRRCGGHLTPRSDLTRRAMVAPDRDRRPRRGRA